MRNLLFILMAIGLSACWPSSFSFRDKGGMPEEWKTFTLKTLELDAATCPLNFAALLSEKMKDGVQNNTPLLLNTTYGIGEVNMEGKITQYSVMPLAVQGNNNASQNRLTMSVAMSINITKPKEEQWTLTTTRFADFNSGTNLSEVENKLFEDISEQMVQDLINKLLSNW
ncbi:MAG: LPS assembly lipoprotein LptE [Crocinitomicaceae bacterium]